MWKLFPPLVLLAALIPALIPALVPPVYGQSSGDLADYVRTDHPTVYTVQEGDTLWDISNRFLTAPWLWPELWRHNQQIANPHLIYPGDTVRFGYVDGKPTLFVDRGPGGNTFKVDPSSMGDGALRPRIRREPLASAIPAIKLDAIRGFLYNNRIVQSGVLEQAPYVIQGESRRIALGANDRFYIWGDVDLDASYALVRKGSVYVDPETEELLGIEAIDLGLGQVIQHENDVGTVRVLNSRQEINIGDRLLPTEERSVQSTFYPKPPDTEIHGQILRVIGGVSHVAQFDVVAINRGEREGLQEGDVLAIYRRGDLARDPYSSGRIQLPSERGGLLMVFRTFEKLSYGFVLETDQQLSTTDEVRSP